MPDNWNAVAALAFGSYWRWLGKKEREINALRGRNAAGRSTAGRNDAVGNDRASRSQQPSMPGHPRPEPGSKAPIQ
jgi:hypothetical protein